MRDNFFFRNDKIYGRDYRGSMAVYKGSGRKCTNYTKNTGKDSGFYNSTNMDTTVQADTKY